MPVNVKTGFADGDTLRDIRNILLNPIAVKVASLEDKVVTIQSDTDKALRNATVNTSAKTIQFTKGAGAPITTDLTGMFREGSDLKVVDGNSKEVPGVTEIKFEDSQVIQGMKGEVEIHYDWAKLVKENQKLLTIGNTGSAITSKPEALYFKGEGISVDTTNPLISTVTFPAPTKPIMATIPGEGFTTPAEINAIELDGVTTGSIIKDGKLTIQLSAGGGGTPLASQNFLGFFDTLGDLTSFVQKPVDGKSFAFVKDMKIGGIYYTPYFYINGAWKELKQDPALTYEDPKAVSKVGVFSIKPSEKISVDANGQMDLDGLSTPQIPSHFKGFFEDIQKLKDAVPNPVLHQDWAYVKNESGKGWLAYRSDTQGSVRKWNIVAPLGSFAVIDRSVEPNTYAQAFGVYKDNAFEMDSKGLLTLKPVDTTTNVVISDGAGTTTGGKISSIRFENGKPYAQVDGSVLTIKNPQQLINYNATWESNHKVEDHRGNLFYDTTSKTWMGCNDPDTGGGVGNKWTRIAHRGMSDEVKSLVRRVPAKAPDVLPGTLGDSGLWHFNGVTFLEKSNTNLPEEFRDMCGGYITTTVQDQDAPGVSIPQYRMQTCTPDRPEGGTWVRRFISTSSPGSQTSWSDWVRTSFSHKDIEAHQKDIGAHREAIKYHVVFAIAGRIDAIFSQTAGGALGGFHEDNGLMIVDNYGYTNQDKDYMDPPYSGKFRIAGTLSFAGYKEGEKKYPVGRWQILFRKKDKDGANYAPVAQFTYEHTDESKPYPLLSYLAKDIELLDHQEVTINLTFNQTTNLLDKHPDLYLAPTRTYLVLEDNETTSGTLVGEAHRKLYGSLDVIGNVGIKSHHSKLTDPNSSIRVYGEKLDKTPKEMHYTP